MRAVPVRRCDVGKVPGWGWQARRAQYRCCRGLGGRCPGHQRQRRRGPTRCRWTRRVVSQVAVPVSPLPAHHNPTHVGCVHHRWTVWPPGTRATTSAYPETGMPACYRAGRSRRGPAPVDCPAGRHQPQHRVTFRGGLSARRRPEGVRIWPMSGRWEDFGASYCLLHLVVGCVVGWWCGVDSRAVCRVVRSGVWRRVGGCRGPADRVRRGRRSARRGRGGSRR